MSIGVHRLNLGFSSKLSNWLLHLLTFFNLLLSFPLFISVCMTFRLSHGSSLYWSHVCVSDAMLSPAYTLHHFLYPSTFFFLPSFFYFLPSFLPFFTSLTQYLFNLNFVLYSLSFYYFFIFFVCVIILHLFYFP